MNILKNVASRHACLVVACWVVVLAALLALGAGMYIGLYNDLTFDDIARKLANNSSVWGGAKSFYLGETGRFTNGFISQHSGLYDLPVYRSLHIILATIWVACLWLFLKSLFRYFAIQQKYTVATLFCGFIVLVTIANAPALGQWWFWYATASLYMFGTSLLLLSYHVILDALEFKSKALWWLSGLVIFFAVGSSEMIMFVAISTSLVLALVLAIRQQNNYAIIPFVFAVMGGLLVVLSPGTSTRLATVSGNSVYMQVSSQLLELPSGILQTMLSGIKYWTKDVFWLLLLIAGFASGLLVDINDSKRVNIKTALVLLIMFAVIVISLSALVVFMGWKININDPSRTNNLAYFLFLLMIAVNSLYAGLLCKQKLKFSLPVLNSIGVVLLLVSLSTIVVSSHSNNIEVMYEDIKYNKPERQMLSIKHWDKVISEAIDNGETNVVVPNMIPANTLTVYQRGPAIDPSYAMNRYWKGYKGLVNNQKFSRRNFDQFLLESVRQQYQPITGKYNLQSYKDKYRNYVIVQIPERTRNVEKLCINLLPDNDKNYSLRIRDENYAQLFFYWESNHLCTDFVSRKVYCEPHKGDWLCRIPLPLSFSGVVKTVWGNVQKEIKIK